MSGQRAGRLTPLRVLVVDDDAGARLLHGRFVSETPGFALGASVGTGTAAVEHALRGDVDLVLLDMRLPDISGVEVLHRLRTLGDRSPDVLVISSSRDRVTVRQALAARVVGYLVKPFTAAALQGRLRAYAAERAARGSGAEAGAESAGQAHEVPLAQGEIDRLLAPRATTTDPAPAALPKGIARVTLDRVLDALDPRAAVTSAELAERCAISSPTARRYLDFLTTTGRVDIAHRYGKRGRPEVLYRLAPVGG